MEYELRLPMCVFGVITRASERARLHMLHTETLAKSLEMIKLLGLNKSSDRKMIGCRSQILPDGDNLHANTGEINQGFLYFLARLTHTHNHSRLCRETSSTTTCKHRKAARIPSRWSHCALQSGNCLDVVGMGETRQEVEATLIDLASVGVQIVTIGQYLRPTTNHLPVARFVEPQEFDHYKAFGESLGMQHVQSSPLTRSSYHAKHAHGQSQLVLHA